MLVGFLSNKQNPTKGTRKLAKPIPATLVGCPQSRASQGEQLLLRWLDAWQNENWGGNPYNRGNSILGILGGTVEIPLLLIDMPHTSSTSYETRSGRAVEIKGNRNTTAGKGNRVVVAAAATVLT